MSILTRSHRSMVSASLLVSGLLVAGCGQASPTAASHPVNAGQTHPASQAVRAAASQKPAQPAARAARKSLPSLQAKITPSGQNISGTAQITVRFSAPLKAVAETAKPTISPAIAGRWTEPNRETLVFTPISAWLPEANVQVSLPAHFAGASSNSAKAVRSSFQVENGSTTRLVQVLAQLGYLPVHLSDTQQPAQTDLAADRHAIYQPPAAKLVLGTGWPSQLAQLWQTDQALIVKGAVVNFESQHQLAMDGSAGPKVWSALISAEVKNQHNISGYTYAIGSEKSPETLTVYHNGKVVLKSLANTGIAAAPTATGNYLVYERLRSQIMRGTNPDGTTYADPVQWVAYFNGGDAVHYFDRASYGFQQSLGCIELPYAAAEKAWGYLDYGTPVSVLPS